MNRIQAGIPCGIFFLCCILFATVTWAETQPERRSGWTQAMENLPKNAWDAHIGWTTSTAHLIGIGMTPLFMESGADHWIQNQAAQHGKWASMSWSGPAMLMGFAAPIAVPATIFWLSDDPVHIRAGAAAAQSALVAFTSNLILKSITNRTAPESRVRSEADAVHGFRFGWWRQVPFDGWPSGHVMTNTALVSALATYYRTPWVTAGAVAWSSYMIAAVSIGISGGVHWTSDAATGLIMGATIGATIGSRFRLDEPEPSRVQLLPFQMGDATGLSVSGRW